MDLTAKPWSAGGWVVDLLPSLVIRQLPRRAIESKADVMKTILAVLLLVSTSFGQSIKWTSPLDPPPGVSNQPQYAGQEPWLLDGVGGIVMPMQYPGGSLRVFWINGRGKVAPIDFDAAQAPFVRVFRVSPRALYCLVGDKLRKYTRKGDTLDFHETDIADGQGFGIPFGVYSKQDGWGFHVIIYGSTGISVRRFSN